jgi:hypothetical protein
MDSTAVAAMGGADVPEGPHDGLAIRDGSDLLLDELAENCVAPSMMSKKTNLNTSSTSSTGACNARVCFWTFGLLALTMSQKVNTMALQSGLAPTFAMINLKTSALPSS